MKTLSFIPFIVFLTASLAHAEVNDSKLTVGMDWSRAKNILARSDIREVKRHLSVLYPPEQDVLYYKIEERVDLVITINKKDRKIKNLSIRFSPRYNPVKGLDTYKALEYIMFDSESYLVKIRKTNKDL